VSIEVTLELEHLVAPEAGGQVGAAKQAIVCGGIEHHLGQTPVESESEVAPLVALLVLAGSGRVAVVTDFKVPTGEFHDAVGAATVFALIEDRARVAGPSGARHRVKPVAPGELIEAIPALPVVSCCEDRSCDPENCASEHNDGNDLRGD